jgi:NADH-quinone oxidoreductase subunit C
MKTAEEIIAAIKVALPDAGVVLIPNPSPSGQHSLLLGHETAVAVAAFLRDDAELALDYCSNASGVDWPDKEVSEKVKTAKVVDGVETVVEETIRRIEPGYLEAVYHLFSMSKGPAEGGGPVVLRLRTANRTDQVKLPSLTPVWRSCEFQEREIFDLYGIVFTGHPDLRRILMWDEFEDHPMRKDYVDPDDYEYEPTPHDEVLKRAQEHDAQPAPIPAGVVL